MDDSHDADQCGDNTACIIMYLFIVAGTLRASGGRREPMLHGRRDPGYDTIARRLHVTQPLCIVCSAFIRQERVVEHNRHRGVCYSVSKTMLQAVSRYDRLMYMPCKWCGDLCACCCCVDRQLHRGVDGVDGRCTSIAGLNNLSSACSSRHFQVNINNVLHSYKRTCGVA